MENYLQVLGMIILIIHWPFMTIERWVTLHYDELFLERYFESSDDDSECNEK